MFNKVANIVAGVGILVSFVVFCVLIRKTPPLVIESPTKDVSSNKECPVTILPVQHAEKKPEVLRLKLDKNRVIQLNSPVMPESIGPIITQLRKLDKDNKPIYLLLNSPGGSVLSGAGLISQMQGMKSPVYTVCTELCASMAAFIHQYGIKRYATDRAILMFHPASGGSGGQIKNNLSRMQFIDNYVEKMNKYVIDRSKVNKAEYDKLVAYELWIDAEDSLTKGLLDNVVSLDVDLDPSAPTLPPQPDEHHKALKEIRDVQ